MFSAHVQRTLCLPLRVKSLTSLLCNNQSAAAGDSSNSISDYGEVSGGLGLAVLTIGENDGLIVPHPRAVAFNSNISIVFLALFKVEGTASGAALTLLSMYNALFTGLDANIVGANLSYSIRLSIAGHIAVFIKLLIRIIDCNINQMIALPVGRAFLADSLTFSTSTVMVTLPSSSVTAFPPQSALVLG